MLTMSTSDKTSTIRACFGEKENASKDTNNVNNLEYVTHIQTIQAGNRVLKYMAPLFAQLSLRLSHGAFFYKVVVCSNNTVL